jgi:chorismate synthase
MSGNSFGHIFKLTSFGESHGTAIGGIVEGCPAGLMLNPDLVQQALDRRKPGQSAITTPRKENDTVHFLSGIFDGVTTGAPIGFTLANANQQPADYDQLKEVFRPSHADYTYLQKYGLRDHRGGGRSSARETACRVVAGAIASQLLAHNGISIHAFVKSVGDISLDKPLEEIDLTQTETNMVRCPDAAVAAQMIAAIEQARTDGDSLGGMVTGVIKGLPVGLGEPVFDKFHAVLGHAMLSINAVKGFEYGSGFAGTRLKGSQHNDAFTNEQGKIKTLTNRSGGVQGGLTNGMDVYFNVAFKPTATISKEQQTVDLQGKLTTLEARGRHDPCVLPRAVPIVEAMAAMVSADFLLLNRLSKL